MPKKHKKRSRGGAPATKPRKPVEQAPATDATEPLPVGAAPSAAEVDAATQRFKNDLLIRGEAAKLDKKGKLPGHATHVIKKQDEDGTAEVERVRFKTF